MLKSNYYDIRAIILYMFDFVYRPSHCNRTIQIWNGLYVIFILYALFINRIIKSYLVYL